MNKINSFKDLTVWQKSFDLVLNVYKLTDGLPKIELYGLSDQMKRSATSIPSNIAEGSKRGSRKDFKQFVRVAYGSSAELETQLLLAKELYNVDISNLISNLSDIQKMLSGLIKKLSTDN